MGAMLSKVTLDFCCLNSIFGQNNNSASHTIKSCEYLFNMNLHKIIGLQLCGICVSYIDSESFLKIVFSLQINSGKELKILSQAF